MSGNSKLVWFIFPSRGWFNSEYLSKQSTYRVQRINWFGFLTLKSSYNFLVKENISLNLSIRSPNPQQDLYRKIWGAMVPNKVRNFMWRSCMQSLWSWIWFITVLSEDVCKHCWNCSKIVLHTMGMPRTQCHMGIRLLGVVLSDHALLNLHGINATYHEGRKEPRIVRHNSWDHLVSQKHDPN